MLPVLDFDDFSELHQLALNIYILVKKKTSEVCFLVSFFFRWLSEFRIISVLSVSMQSTINDQV